MPSVKGIMQITSQFILKVRLRLKNYLTGKVIRELTHAALSDVAGGVFNCLYDASVRGDKMAVCTHIDC